MMALVASQNPTTTGETDHVNCLHEPPSTDGEQPIGGSQLLYQPEDRERLSDLVCLVRSQIEVFAATTSDVSIRAPRGGVRDNVDVGRVGIRCVHCARGGTSADRAKRVGGGVSYPKSIRLVYQAVRNWQRNHLLKCPSVPAEVKREYLALKTNNCHRRSGNDSTRYWEESCRKLGLVDTDVGLRLRRGAFDGHAGVDNAAAIGGETTASVVLPDEMWTRSDSNAVSRSGHVPGVDEGEAQTLSKGQGVANGELPMPIHEFDLDREGIEAKNKESLESVVGDNCSPSLGNGFVSEENLRSQAGAVLRKSSPQDQSAANIPTISKSSSPSLTLEQRVSTAVSFAQSGSPAITFQQSGSPSQSFKQSNSPSLTFRQSSSPSLTLPNEVVLERVELAYSIVQTLGQICEVPPMKAPNGSAASVDGADFNPHQHEDLSSIGAELYELFLGHHPLDCENSEFDEETLETTSLGLAEVSMADPSKRKKRGKRPERRKYTPLRELGLPVTLCILVSSLLDSSCGGSCDYKSIDEVEEDLRLMAAEPQRFLFGSVTGELHIPQNTLYSRKEETSKLIMAYDRAMTTSGGTSEMVLISGYSGTGKTSLVQYVQGHFITRGARFMSGKFDAMRQAQPLSAIFSALDDYFDILAWDTEGLDQVRCAIASAVGSEGKVLTDLIPNLGRIIDVTDEPSVQVGGKQAQQRLMFLFRMLFRAMSSHSNPIVLFLDDLQWADEASLELLRVLIMDLQIEALLLIGSYRDNEIGPDHPLMAHIHEIQRSGNTVNITPIHVGNLGEDGINALLSDALHLMPRMTRSLTEIVLTKTGGNALFVVQLLASLCDEGLLRFSLSTRRWEWDLDGIRARNIADNVVELMTAKLLRLAPKVHEALRVAAAFGAQCQEALLRILDEGDGRPVGGGEIADLLKVAVAEGLMVKVGSAYWFSHDQIQHAAYLLIPKAERETFHLQIGRSLWKNSSDEDMNNYLFVVVDQLHRGVSLIADPNEKVNLARLSLMAGRQASAMSAFLPASVYLKAGIGLLADDDWERHRELCFDLFDTCAETEYILGDFMGMKECLEGVFARARTLREKLRAYYTLVQSLGSQQNIADAIDATIEVLGYLGVSLPLSPNQMAVKNDLAITQELLSSVSESTLLQLETMKEGDKREAMKFLQLISMFVYTESPQYFALIICRMVRLSLSHGVCRESANAFACYGVILCGPVFDYSGGYRFGKLALSILERFQAKECLARVYGVVYGFINQWTEPIQACLPNLVHGVDVGLSTGDTAFAMTNALLYLGTALWSGMPLDPLMEKITVYSKQMVEYKQHFMYNSNKPFRQAVLNLIGRSTDPVKLIGEEMDEDNMLMNAEEKMSLAFVRQFYFYRMWLAYLFGRYELAAEMAEKNGVVGKMSSGRFSMECNHTFYNGLTALALARRTGQMKWKAVADESVAQMKIWAASTPWNCEHKLELLNAEYAFLEGETGRAAKAYDSAASIAAEHHFVHEQALALERAGIFYSERGDHATASGFFTRAHDCYTQWGAHSKANHVQEHYL